MESVQEFKNLNYYYYYYICYSQRITTEAECQYYKVQERPVSAAEQSSQKAGAREVGEQRAGGGEHHQKGR